MEEKDIEFMTRSEAKDALAESHVNERVYLTIIISLLAIIFLGFSL